MWKWACAAIAAPRRRRWILALVPGVCALSACGSPYDYRASEVRFESTYRVNNIETNVTVYLAKPLDSEGYRTITKEFYDRYDDIWVSFECESPAGKQLFIGIWDKPTSSGYYTIEKSDSCD